MLGAAAFDHVALALPSREPFWDVFACDLGGRWVGGHDTDRGFSVAQLRYANGMKVEALEPRPDGDDFLVRFLADRGPGPHHLTFKVDDLPATIERAEAAGYQALGIALDGPFWKEAFLHPRQASGIVVQLAWAAGELDDPPPPDLPAPRGAEPAELVHVAHAVADLEGALDLFKGLLGGHTVDAGAGGGLGFVDLAYPGPGRLRLLAGGPTAAWVGTQPGRLHSLCFRLGDPGGVAGAVARDGWWEVAAAAPLGVRLVLLEPDAPVPVAG